MKLNFTQIYKRIDNILYCDDIAIIKFTHSKFPNFDPLSEQGVKYMQSYINMWPQHFEILEGWITTDDVEEEIIDIEKCRTSIEYFVEKVVKGPQVIPFHHTITSQWIENDFNPQWSRQQQVQFYLERGYTSASAIAQKINANPSYIQRLLKQLQNESQE
jgi:hypothetical protein